MNANGSDRFLGDTSEEDKQFFIRYMRMNESQKTCIREFSEIVLRHKELTSNFVSEFNDAFIESGRLLTMEYFQRFLVDSSGTSKSHVLNA